MTNPVADYQAAVAALAAARDEVRAEFATAKAERQADPTSEAKKARYAAARDALQALRALDRADRGPVPTVAGDAVATQEG